MVSKEFISFESTSHYEALDNPELTHYVDQDDLERIEIYLFSEFWDERCGTPRLRYLKFSSNAFFFFKLRQC